MGRQREKDGEGEGESEVHMAMVRGWCKTSIGRNGLRKGTKRDGWPFSVRILRATLIT